MNWSTELSNLTTVLFAGGLGAVVGLERELSHKPAGLRTHIFVCAGSALLMLLGDAIVMEFANPQGDQINADPIRIVQSIVVGISFLGAGTIIHAGQQRVEGLTTAASIFLTAGIGVAVAVERPILAVGTALFAVAVLWMVGWIEERFTGRDHERSLHVSSSQPQTGRSADDDSPAAPASPPVTKIPPSA